MGTSFHDRLAATRDKKHSKNHPFFELWAQGKLTKEQTAFYCTQHYHYVVEFLNWLAFEASQIPQRDVKTYLADEIHGSKGFAIVEKYCGTPELQALALKMVEEAAIRRWRYMNGIYWYALHGREDETPALPG